MLDDNTTIAYAFHSVICVQQFVGSISSRLLIQDCFCSYQGSYKLLQNFFQNFSKAKLLNFQTAGRSYGTMKYFLVRILKLRKNRKTLFSMLYFMIFWWIMFCIINSKMNKHSIYGF